MTIKQVFRLTYLVFVFFMVLMIGLLVLISYNQHQIEENAVLSVLGDNDLRQANMYIRWLVVLVCLLGVLLVILYRIVNSRIAQPVQALLEQTRMVQGDQNRLTEQIIEISTGNLEADFRINTQPLLMRHNDEFRELAEAANAMIGNLGETGLAISAIIMGIKTARDKLSDVNQWLEKTVEERTSDLRQAHAELEQAHLELRSLDKAKSDFLRMVSHEIRTPLNGIQGFTYLMKDMPQAPEVAEVFDMLEISVKRLERFSLVALLITELQAGNKNVRREEVIILDLVNEVINRLDEKARTKNLQVSTNGFVAQEGIRGDRKMLTMCVESILDNAITYSPEGGMITIESFNANNRHCLQFIDRGPGFSEDALKTLFKPFSPGEQHIDENVGLDLALAKMIMDAHGGNITVANNPEGGACVTLRFVI